MSAGADSDPANDSTESLTKEAERRAGDRCAQRAAVYEALVFGLRQPSAAYLTALIDGSLGEGLRSAVSGLDCDESTYKPALAAFDRARRWAGECGLDEALSALGVEHARLFTGPGRPVVLCYASQYLDRDGHGPGRLNEAAAAYAAAAYRAEGVALVDEPHELPDHVVLELEFAFHLCRRAELAWTNGDESEATRLERVLCEFLDGHARPWLVEFAAAVASFARMDLYRALAGFLLAHLTVEFGQRGQPSEA